ncbi:MAG: hypothetical protein NTY84_09860 [Verrucomicrobia bacterium]|nr:hypothetical protein [Verrucomicrobiota bacterium]
MGLALAGTISGDAELRLPPYFQRPVAPGRSIVPVLRCAGITRGLSAFTGGTSPTLLSALVAGAGLKAGAAKMSPSGDKIRSASGKDRRRVT